MSQAYISPTLRKTISERDNFRCSYCLTAEHIVGADFTVDHIIPESLGGPTTVDNLCLACWGCNLYKQDNIVAPDPDTGVIVRLFHPLRQYWQDHFIWLERGLLIAGVTPIGRATVQTVRLNRLPLVRSRRLWTHAGWHPPLT